MGVIGGKKLNAELWIKHVSYRSGSILNLLFV